VRLILAQVRPWVSQCFVSQLLIIKLNRLNKLIYIINGNSSETQFWSNCTSLQHPAITSANLFPNKWLQKIVVQSRLWWLFFFFLIIQIDKIYCWVDFYHVKTIKKKVLPLVFNIIFFLNSWSDLYLVHFLAQIY
jgi:hypothetical protein